MHILMTVNSAWNIWNFRRPVVQTLLDNHHRVTVLAPPDDSVSKLTAMGCHFIPLQMDAKGLNPLQGYKLIRRFQHHFRDTRPDAIFSYTIKNNILGAIAAKSCDIPFIPNVTGLGTAFLSGGPLRVFAQGLYRYAFRQLPIIYFQNTNDRNLFIQRKLVQTKQAQLLPGSGIDLDYFTPAEFPDENEAPVFLMIARLLRDKGVMEFVDAARQLKKLAPQARFQLLGATESENRTAIDTNTVNSWQQAGLIEYLGTTADVRPYIAAAHAVVLPSYREGAPRTLIEAAAMARPLIATDVAGCNSVVEHNKTGLLCEVRNAQSLSSTCLQFLSLPHYQKAAMGQAGRAKMEQEFNQSIVVDAYLGALEKLAYRSTTKSYRQSQASKEHHESTASTPPQH